DRAADDVGPELRRLCDRLFGFGFGGGRYADAGANFGAASGLLRELAQLIGLFFGRNRLDRAATAAATPPASLCRDGDRRHRLGQHVLAVDVEDSDLNGLSGR